jgi:hypothetical protein
MFGERNEDVSFLLRPPRPLLLSLSFAPPLQAIAKYGKGQSTDDLATAVGLLIERNILAHLVGHTEGGRGLCAVVCGFRFIGLPWECDVCWRTWVGGLGGVGGWAGLGLCAVVRVLYGALPSPRAWWGLGGMGGWSGVGWGGVECSGVEGMCVCRSQPPGAPGVCDGAGRLGSRWVVVVLWVLWVVVVLWGRPFPPSPRTPTPFPLPHSPRARPWRPTPSARSGYTTRRCVEL